VTTVIGSTIVIGGEVRGDAYVVVRASGSVVACVELVTWPRSSVAYDVLMPRALVRELNPAHVSYANEPVSAPVIELNCPSELYA
jgi:hypothetical protein